MPPKSLFELAVMAVIRNIKLLESVGDLPYEAVKDILAKIDNPDQLRKIECECEQIRGRNSDLWLKFINRDFPVERKANPMWPDDPAGWWKIYEKYKKVHKTSLEGHGNILQAALAGLKEDKEKHTSQIVQASMLPPSLRDVTKRSWGSRPRGPAKSSSGANAMAKIKKEASKISNIRNTTPSIAIAGPAAIRAPTASTGIHTNHANTRNDIFSKSLAALPPKVGAAFRLKAASRPFKEAARATARAPKTHEAPEQKAPQALKRKRDETPEREAPTDDGISTPVPKKKRSDGMPQSPSDSPTRRLPSPPSADELIEQLNAREEEHQQQQRAKPPRKKKPVNVFMNPKKRIH